MQQLLCEPEDRLGLQASSSAVRPKSMIVQARRSTFITPSGATRGGVIKASRARKNGGTLFVFLVLLTWFYRHTLSFVGLIVPIFSVTPAHSLLGSTIPRTRGTSTMTCQLGCPQWALHSEGDPSPQHHSRRERHLGPGVKQRTSYPRTSMRCYTA
jgi:hypothetical protein